MKQIIVLVLFLICGKMVGQKMLPMPVNAQPGKGYVLCIEYDTSFSKKNYGAFIPPFGWEEVLIEKTPKYQRYTLELPVFDSILLKIPVDKTTRMANIPDRYSLVNDKIMVKPTICKWVFVTKPKECLSADPANCLPIVLIEVVPEYQKVEKLVLQSSSHQQRFDDIDTVTFKQIIEIKPLKKISIEVAPTYKKILMKTNPHASYGEWREFLCSGGPPNHTTLKIQKVLKERGYYHGKLDDIIGKETKAALIEFQKVHKLETGRLSLETLKELGLYNEDDD
jgi:hypothetical protein